MKRIDNKIFTVNTHPIIPEMLNITVQLLNIVIPA